MEIDKLLPSIHVALGAVIAVGYQEYRKREDLKKIERSAVTRFLAILTFLRTLGDVDHILTSEDVVERLFSTHSDTIYQSRNHQLQSDFIFISHLLLMKRAGPMRYAALKTESMKLKFDSMITDYSRKTFKR